MNSNYNQHGVDVSKIKVGDVVHAGFTFYSVAEITEKNFYTNGGIYIRRDDVYRHYARQPRRSEP